MAPHSAASINGWVTSRASAYATVSRYAARHAPAQDIGEYPRTSIPRRPSRPALDESEQQQRPHSAPMPTETTPLILLPARNTEGGTAAEYWEELKILTRYSLPVFGTHLLEYSLIIAPVFSIGHLSTTALAAITLGSMTAGVSGFSILEGMVSALDTMLPSAWTSSEPQLVGLWSQRMVVVMGASLIPMYCIWWNAEAILLVLRQEPEVAHLAAVYLRWVSLGLPAYAVNLVSGRYFQAQGLFDVPTRIVCLVAPVNALLNYLLVWGPEPIRLGYIGAPIATACSFNLVCIMNFTSLGVLVNLGIAGVGQTASDWWAWELIALAASLLGRVPLATQSILLESASTTYQAPFALSVASSVRIGNLLGELNAPRAKVAAHVSLLMALGVGLIFSTMFMVFRHSWGKLFNDDPRVITLVASILPLVALFQVFEGGAAVAGGILRAKGKQMTGALLNLSAYYILGIPLGALLAFHAPMRMGLHGLWTGLTVALVYSAVAGTVLCLRTDWEREVGKVVKRVEDEARAAEEGEGEAELESD
ncbi:RNA helicase [Mycena kentingensis (nom. inval.)]|nr:RNA helicase [Mycena kentingensis (nom. inval.)]